MIPATKPPYDLTTNRLGLRPWCKDDIEPFAKINSDREVMMYFPFRLSSRGSEALVERIMTQYKVHGYCFWATDLLKSGAFIGFIGLNYNTMEAHFTPCVEIGWRLHKDVWGQGLATEGAKACLDFAFDQVGIEKVYAFTPLANKPSERVMQKIGMRHIGTFSHPRLAAGHPLEEHHLYMINMQV